MASLDAVIENRTRAALGVLARRAGLVAAYVFGSRVEGTPSVWSDIDIAVFLKDTADWDLPTRIRAIVEVQTEAGDDIEIHFFPADALQDPDTASFAAYVIRHGVRLALP